MAHHSLRASRPSSAGSNDKISSEKEKWLRIFLGALTDGETIELDIRLLKKEFMSQYRKSCSKLIARAVRLHSLGEMASSSTIALQVEENGSFTTGIEKQPEEGWEAFMRLETLSQNPEYSKLLKMEDHKRTLIEIILSQRQEEFTDITDKLSSHSISSLDRMSDSQAADFLASSDLGLDEPDFNSIVSRITKPDIRMGTRNSKITSDRTLRQSSGAQKRANLSRDCRSSSAPDDEHYTTDVRELISTMTSVQPAYSTKLLKAKRELLAVAGKKEQLRFPVEKQQLGQCIYSIPNQIVSDNEGAILLPMDFEDLVSMICQAIVFGDKTSLSYLLDNVWDSGIGHWVMKKCLGVSGDENLRQVCKELGDSEDPDYKTMCESIVVMLEHSAISLILIMAGVSVSAVSSNLGIIMGEKFISALKAEMFKRNKFGIGSNPRFMERLKHKVRLKVSLSPRMPALEQDQRCRQKVVKCTKFLEQLYEKILSDDYTSNNQGVVFFKRSLREDMEGLIMGLSISCDGTVLGFCRELESLSRSIMGPTDEDIEMLGKIERITTTIENVSQGVIGAFADSIVSELRSSTDEEIISLKYKIMSRTDDTALLELCQRVIGRMFEIVMMEITCHSVWRNVIHDNEKSLCIREILQNESVEFHDQSLGFLTSLKKTPDAYAWVPKSVYFWLFTSHEDQNDLTEEQCPQDTVVINSFSSYIGLCHDMDEKIQALRIPRTAKLSTEQCLILFEFGLVRETSRKAQKDISKYCGLDLLRSEGLQIGIVSLAVDKKTVPKSSLLEVQGANVSGTILSFRKALASLITLEQSMDIRQEDGMATKGVIPIMSSRTMPSGGPKNAVKKLSAMTWVTEEGHEAKYIPIKIIERFTRLIEDTSNFQDLTGLNQEIGDETLFRIIDNMQVGLTVGSKIKTSQIMMPIQESNKENDITDYLNSIRQVDLESVEYEQLVYKSEKSQKSKTVTMNLMGRITSKIIAASAQPKHTEESLQLFIAECPKIETLADSSEISLNDFICSMAMRDIYRVQQIKFNLLNVGKEEFADFSNIRSNNDVRTEKQKVRDKMCSVLANLATGIDSMYTRTHPGGRLLLKKGMIVIPFAFLLKNSRLKLGVPDRTLESSKLEDQLEACSQMADWADDYLGNPDSPEALAQAIADILRFPCFCGGREKISIRETNIQICTCELIGMDRDMIVFSEREAKIDPCVEEKSLSSYYQTILALSFYNLSNGHRHPSAGLCSVHNIPDLDDSKMIDNHFNSQLDKPLSVREEIREEKLKAKVFDIPRVTKYSAIHPAFKSVGSKILSAGLVAKEKESVIETLTSTSPNYLLNELSDKFRLAFEKAVDFADLEGLFLVHRIARDVLKSGQSQNKKKILYRSNGGVIRTTTIIPAKGRSNVEVLVRISGQEPIATGFDMKECVCLINAPYFLIQKMLDIIEALDTDSGYRSTSQALDAMCIPVSDDDRKSMSRSIRDIMALSERVRIGKIEEQKLALISINILLGRISARPINERLFFHASILGTISFPAILANNQIHNTTLQQLRYIYGFCLSTHYSMNQMAQKMNETPRSIEAQIHSNLILSCGALALMNCRGYEKDIKNKFWGSKTGFLNPITLLPVVNAKDYMNAIYELHYYNRGVMDRSISNSDVFNAYHNRPMVWSALVREMESKSACSKKCFDLNCRDDIHWNRLCMECKTSISKWMIRFQVVIPNFDNVREVTEAIELNYSCLLSDKKPITAGCPILQSLIGESEARAMPTEEVAKFTEEAGARRIPRTELLTSTSIIKSSTESFNPVEEAMNERAKHTQRIINKSSSLSKDDQIKELEAIANDNDLITDESKRILLEYCETLKSESEAASRPDAQSKIINLSVENNTNLLISMFSAGCLRLADEDEYIIHVDAADPVRDIEKIAGLTELSSISSSRADDIGKTIKMSAKEIRVKCSTSNINPATRHLAESLIEKKSGNPKKGHKQEIVDLLKKMEKNALQSRYSSKKSCYQKSMREAVKALHPPTCREATCISSSKELSFCSKLAHVLYIDTAAFKKFMIQNNKQLAAESTRVMVSGFSNSSDSSITLESESTILDRLGGRSHLHCLDQDLRELTESIFTLRQKIQCLNPTSCRSRHVLFNELQETCGKVLKILKEEQLSVLWSLGDLAYNVIPLGLASCEKNTLRYLSASPFGNKLIQEITKTQCQFKNLLRCSLLQISCRDSAANWSEELTSDVTISSSSEVKLAMNFNSDELRISSSLFLAAASMNRSHMSSMKFRSRNIKEKRGFTSSDRAAFEIGRSILSTENGSLWEQVCELLEKDTPFKDKISPKAQFGGARDLVVQDLNTKEIMGLTERVCSSALKLSHYDILEHPWKKQELIKSACRDMRSRSNDPESTNTKIFCASSDETKWGPNHCTVGFMNILSPLFQNSISLGRLIKSSCLLNASKKVFVERRLILNVINILAREGMGIGRRETQEPGQTAFFIFDRSSGVEVTLNEISNRVPFMRDEMDMILRRCILTGKTYIQHYTHMGQGIFHKTSSLANDIISRFCKRMERFFKNEESIVLGRSLMKSSTITFNKSSDDSFAYMCGVPDDVKNYNDDMGYIYQSHTLIALCLNIRKSAKHMHSTNAIIAEVYSTFTTNEIMPPAIKNKAALLTLTPAPSLLKTEVSLLNLANSCLEFGLSLMDIVEACTLARSRNISLAPTTFHPHDTQLISFGGMRKVTIERLIRDPMAEEISTVEILLKRLSDVLIGIKKRSSSMEFEDNAARGDWEVARMSEEITRDMALAAGLQFSAEAIDLKASTHKLRGVREISIFRDPVDEPCDRQLKANMSEIKGSFPVTKADDIELMLSSLLDSRGVPSTQEAVQSKLLQSIHSQVPNAQRSLNVLESYRQFRHCITGFFARPGIFIVSERRFGSIGECRSSISKLNEWQVRVDKFKKLDEIMLEIENRAEAVSSLRGILSSEGRLINACQPSGLPTRADRNLKRVFFKIGGNSDLKVGRTVKMSTVLAYLNRPLLLSEKGMTVRENDVRTSLKRILPHAQFCMVALAIAGNILNKQSDLLSVDETASSSHELLRPYITKDDWSRGLETLSKVINTFKDSDGAQVQDLEKKRVSLYESLLRVIELVDDASAITSEKVTSVCGLVPSNEIGGEEQFLKYNIKHGSVFRITETRNLDKVDRGRDEARLARELINEIKCCISLAGCLTDGAKEKVKQHIFLKRSSLSTMTLTVHEKQFCDSLMQLESIDQRQSIDSIQKRRIKTLFSRRGNVNIFTLVSLPSAGESSSASLVSVVLDCTCPSSKMICMGETFTVNELICLLDGAFREISDWPGMSSVFRLLPAVSGAPLHGRRNCPDGRMILKRQVMIQKEYSIMRKETYTTSKMMNSDCHNIDFYRQINVDWSASESGRGGIIAYEQSATIEFSKNSMMSVEKIRISGYRDRAPAEKDNLDSSCSLARMEMRDSQTGVSSVLKGSRSYKYSEVIGIIDSIAGLTTSRDDLRLRTKKREISLRHDSSLSLIEACHKGAHITVTEDDLIAVRHKAFKADIMAILEFISETTKNSTIDASKMSYVIRSASINMKSCKKIITSAFGESEVLTEGFKLADKIYSLDPGKETKISANHFNRHIRATKTDSTVELVIAIDSSMTSRARQLIHMYSSYFDNDQRSKPQRRAQFAGFSPVYREVGLVESGAHPVVEAVGLLMNVSGCSDTCKIKISKDDRNKKQIVIEIDLRASDWWTNASLMIGAIPFLLGKENVYPGALIDGFSCIAWFLGAYSEPPECITATSLISRELEEFDHSSNTSKISSERLSSPQSPSHLESLQEKEPSVVDSSLEGLLEMLKSTSPCGVGEDDISLDEELI